jgi:hypothetical protein
LRFYCHSCNHKLFIRQFPKGPERLLGEVCGGTPSWTPDGRFLIATEIVGEDAGWGPCRLVLVPVQGGARVRLAREGDEFALTTDGKRLAYAAGNTLKTVHLDANYRFADAPLEMAREPHAIASLHWSGDGQTLIYQGPGVYQGSGYTKAVTDGVMRLINPGAHVDISQVLSDGSALGTEKVGRSELWRVDLKAAPQRPVSRRTVAGVRHHSERSDADLGVTPGWQRCASPDFRDPSV